MEVACRKRSSGAWWLDATARTAVDLIDRPRAGFVSSSTPPSLPARRLEGQGANDARVARLVK